MTASTGNVPGRIFMSYRRDDTAFSAGWLFDRLASRFGSDQVFKDIDSIELGDDFAEVITTAVGSCDVLLALIGDRWLTVTDQNGRRRLEDPRDFVRLEIETALTRNVRVIPILVEGARMPRADELPASLAKLVRRQALELSPQRFDSDAGRLLKVLDRTITEAQEQIRQGAERAAERQRRQIEQSQETTPAGAAAQDLDRVADLLAVAVKTQWERAANERGLAAEPIPVTWGRPSLPLAGPIAAAAGSRRFAPLPGLTPAREGQLTAGQIDDLHAVYGGLRSGRLVIAGAPGAGKTSAAVLLVLAALQYRDQVGAEDRGQVPVPVLFTAQDWDPRRQPLKEWLTRRLQQTYPLFAGRSGAANAGGLIDAGKLTVIVDGLDEIARELRPVALQALNQASFRVVVLSRTAEMASAASQRGVLQGAAAVELHALDPATAAGYLERVQLDPPPEGWQDLIDRIRATPASPLAEALNNPLSLTLIRDTYQSGDDARELLDHYDTIQKRVSGAQAAEEISSHLLDRVLPAAYAPRPGQPPPRYDLQTAQNALAKIAARMNQDGTRDLQWWHIPRWAPLAPRIVVGGLVAWLLVEVVFGLVSLVVFGIVINDMYGGVFAVVEALVYGAVFALVAGVTAGVAARGTGGPPARIGRIGKLRLRLVFTKKSVKFGLLVGGAPGFAAGFGIPSGLVFALVYGPEWSPFINIRAGLGFGVAFGLAFGLVAVVASGLADAFVDPDSTSSPSPAISWRNDRRHAMAIGVMVGVVVGVMVGVVAGVIGGTLSGLRSGLASGLGLGLVGGLVAGLVAGIGISHAWPTRLAAAQLARRWHTPLRLMNFLNDARERNVLRTVGPVYQFRHAACRTALALPQLTAVMTAAQTSRRPERAMANGSANKTDRDGENDARHRRHPATPSPGQRDAPEHRRRGKHASWRS